VQKIVQRGRFNNITHYLVHWRGYEESEATWEPITNLENCEDAIMQFENAIQGKVKSTGEEKRRRGRRSNKELGEEREIVDEHMGEDVKMATNREDASTVTTQLRNNVESKPNVEGEATQQDVLKMHELIEAKREDKSD
jgi:Chromo (CHRromatin Organisation MOdifier) domain